MYEEVFSILVILFGGSFTVKLISWISITDFNSRPSFWSSFIKFYSLYQFHDAPSKRTLKFWKLSNIANIIFWLCFLSIAYYALNIALKAPTN